MDADKNFYFMEMNTRLQVEHPVTEWITGYDLVKLQIQIAAGQKLTLKQEDVAFRGHAVECRVYAEDPASNFMPSPGKITSLNTPGGPGVRDDSGVYPGFEVPIHYDPLISKLTAWGADRGEAIQRMARALGEYKIGGIKTNLWFHRQLMTHAAFLAAELDTGFIDRHPELLQRRETDQHADLALAAAAIKHFKDERKRAMREEAQPAAEANGWKDFNRMAMLFGRGA